MYDNLFKNHFNETFQAEKKITELMAHAHSRYCHWSLGTKVELKVRTEESKPKQAIFILFMIELFQRIGKIRHLENENWNNTDYKVVKKDPFYDLFPTFKKFANKKRGEADVLVAIGIVTGPGGLLGLANLDTVCQNPKRSFNINFYEIDNFFSTVWTVVHEIGHNLGMWHDFSTKPPHYEAGCNYQGWMSYTLINQQPQQWSERSRNDFLAHYSRNRYQWCMPGKLLI